MVLRMWKNNILKGDIQIPFFYYINKNAPFLRPLKYTEPWRGYLGILSEVGVKKIVEKNVLSVVHHSNNSVLFVHLTVLHGLLHRLPRLKYCERHSPKRHKNSRLYLTQSLPFFYYSTIELRRHASLRILSLCLTR